MTAVIDTHTREPEVKVGRKRTPDAPPLAFGPAKILHPYYDFGPLLSYNAMWNFLVGGRGLGKTYGAKKRAIKRAVERREQFIYLRRYEEELKNLDTFFADLQHEFPQWDLRVQGRRFEAAPASSRDNRKREWFTIGYAIPLSTAQKQKSIPYPLVTTIIFDEFIIERGLIRYLPAEADVFKNFYLTVDRQQDKTKVFFLANSVSIANPYFIEYNILPDEGDEYIRDPSPNRYWIAHFPKAEDFAASVKKTRFGQFIAGSEYEKYAVGNEFADNHQGLVSEKHSRAKHMFNFESRVGTFSVWHDVVEDQYFVYKRVPHGQLTVTLLPERMDEEKILLTPNDLLIKRLQTAFRHKRMWFDGPVARNMWLDVMRVAA